MSNSPIYMVSRIHLTKIEHLQKNQIWSFASDTSKTSTLLMIFDARNWNLFLIQFMLICAKMRRLGFSSVNDFRLMFWHLLFSLSLSIWLLESLDVLRQTASWSSSATPAYPSYFQNLLIRSKKFIVKLLLLLLIYCDPDSFKYKPIWLKCSLMIFLHINYINI